MQSPYDCCHDLWNCIVIPPDQPGSDTCNPRIIDPVPSAMDDQNFLNAATLRNIGLELNSKLQSKRLMKTKSPPECLYAAALSSPTVFDAKWFKRDFESREDGTCDSSCSFVKMQRGASRFNPIEFQYESTLLCADGTLIFRWRSRFECTGN